MSASLRKLPRSDKKELRAHLEQAEETADNALGHSLPGADLTWRNWVQAHFPHVCTHPFAPRHERLWDWFEALIPGVCPLSRVEIWPRGGAKSSSGELGTVRVGVKLTRRFVLYLSETQEQANKHVQAVSSLFERLGVGRAVNPFGNSKGWKVNLLRTENGFNVLALGLDSAARGIKMDTYRPDLMIFDDIDGRHDTPKTTQKKIELLTETILPAGSSDLAVLVLQNLIISNGIVAKLENKTADFLYDREVSPVEKAVIDLKVEQRPQADGTLHYFVTGGKPTWEGQSLSIVEQQINKVGLRAFLRESQQEVEDEEGGLWNRDLLDLTRWKGALPDLLRVGVGVDPNAGEGGDEAGIIVAGIALLQDTLHAFVLEDASVAGGPKAWADACVSAFHKWQADILVAEKNNGGEMVGITIGTVPGAPGVELVHASRGKITRAEPVQKLYADGRAHHVGTFGLLERELCTYKPLTGMLSPNRMDALVWIITKLLSLSLDDDSAPIDPRLLRPQAVSRQDTSTNTNSLGAPAPYIARIVRR